MSSFINEAGDNVKFFKVIQNFNYKTLRECFDNVEADLKKKLKPEQHKNLFYTVGHHLQGKRTFSSWQAQDIIPFDLDGIDLDRIAEYPPLLAEVLEFDLTKTAIVHSGNGCHVLVQVPFWNDKDFIKTAKLGYRQLLERFVAACEEKGLPIDKDTTCWDYARVLRLPFTKNIKEKDGVEVIKEAKLFYNGLSEQDFKVPIIDAPPSHALKKGSFPNADIDYITTQCEFFKWLGDHPEEVHEPHAYAMLSISGHFDDDNKTSRELWDNFDSPSINSKLLGEFTEQAITTSGPRTCEGINDLWGKCESCPHYNKVTSPIMLKSDDFIGTEKMGFTLLGSKGGKIRQYEDLVRFFEREKHYKHITATGQLFIYENGYFKEVKDGYVKNFALEHFTSPTKATERLEFLNYVKDFRDDSSDFLNGVDNDGLINFKNGVLDIKTGTLHPHDHKYGFFYCLPYDYDPNAECPTWDEFLKDITLDRKDLANILEEYLGFCIRGGRYKYHKALILSGDGKNGKSTFNDVLRAIVGEENISSTSLTKMSVSTFALSDLQGKLVNISEEEPPTCFKETGIFKNITGENKVTAEKKFKDSFQMVNKAKIIITYNEMPFINDTSTGMRRRLLIVPFDLDLEHGEKKANANIINDLRSEISGIANRAIEGYRRLDAQGHFTNSEAVDMEVQDIMEDSNPFYAWFNERCSDVRNDENAYEKIKDVYNDYVGYMDDCNLSRVTLGLRKVTKILRQKGFETTQKRVNGANCKVLSGIKILQHGESKKF